MIREDRELLAALARLNSEVAPLAMKIMDGSATAEEQYSHTVELPLSSTGTDGTARHRPVLGHAGDDEHD